MPFFQVFSDRLSNEMKNKTRGHSIRPFLSTLTRRPLGKLLLIGPEWRHLSAARVLIRQQWRHFGPARRVRELGVQAPPPAT